MPKACVAGDLLHVDVQQHVCPCATPVPANPEQTQASDPVTSPGWALLLTITVVGVFGFFQVYSVQSILPELQRDLDASVVEIGTAVGATVLSMALVAPVMGMVSDALGRKWLIVASITLMAVPTMLMAQVETVGGLTLLRFLQGLAVPGMSVAMAAYIAEEFGAAVIVRMMSLFIAGSVLGGFLGRFLLGHLSEFMSWRLAFVALGLLNLVGAACVWRVLPPSRRFVAEARVANAFSNLGALLRHPVVHVACALGFTALFGQVAIFTFINFHLAAPPYGFGPAQLANVFAVYLLGIVVTPLAGRLSARLGIRPTVLAAVLLSMLGVLLTLLPWVTGIVAALALAACGQFITQFATISFIASNITHGRSLATGLYYTTYYVGGFSGAWLGGHAYGFGAWPATVVLVFVVQLLGWIVAWRFMATPSTKTVSA